MFQSFMRIIIFYYLSSVVLGQTSYKIINLGTLGGVTSSARSINDSTEIVGTSLTGNVNHAFLWHDSVMTDLGTLGGSGDVSVGHSINNLGRIAGQSTVNSPGTIHGFFRQNGIMTDIGTLGGPWSVAYAINNQGQLAGHSQIENGEYRAILWQNGSMTNLGTLGGNSSAAYDINNLSQIVGYARTASDEGHIFLWQNGNMADLGIYGYGYGINNQSQVVGYEIIGSTPAAILWEAGNVTYLGSIGSNGSVAYKINDSSQVVGTSSNIAFLWEDGEMKNLNDLIDPSAGWNLLSAYDINNKGWIVGDGIINGQQRAFLLVPEGFKVTSPESNELWIAGTTDTICWTGGPDTVDIFLSLDYKNGSGTFLPVMLNYIVDERIYAIDIPDSILSRRCCIRIQSSSDSTDRAESEIFKIKGYVLTRLRADGSYEAFIPNEDGWSFGNIDSNMWPPLWWVQFNYQSGFDPITGQLYPQEYFGSVLSYNFPDWPLFVEVFTTPKCYFNTSPSPVYKPSSIQRWKDIVGFTWSGACSGFSVSSLLAFCFEQDFLNQFPIGTYANLYDLQIDNFRRIVVNQLQTYYDGKEHTSYNKQRKNLTPQQTLAELKEMLKGEQINGRYLYLNSGSSAHAVVPYRLVKELPSQSVYYVDVYDCNHPGISLSVIIDSAANTWDYNDLGWSGNSGCRLMDEVSTYLQHPTLSPILAETPTSPLIGESYLQIYNTSGADILLTDSNGNSIGIQDSVVINTLPDGIPIIPITSRYEPPIGYYVPEDRYTIQLSSFTDSVSRFSSFSDSIVFSFQRYEAQQNQTDKIILETNGMSLLNPDTQTKLSNFKTILIEENLEKVFDILEYNIEQNDSVFFGMTSYDHLRLVNAGPQKNYILKLHHATTTGQMRFYNSGVPIPENSAEELIPDWNDLSEPVKVFVDLGNNGTIDDSLYLNNTVDVKNEGNLLTPTEFNLAQNYPNPFNPVTTIQYSIAQRSSVLLKVYDVLGNEVSTLVNEEKERGVYAVNFDASLLASGIYLYRLRAGSFVETKKMILLR
jgi:probable HAF family extracellular repeat protein